MSPIHPNKNVDPRDPDGGAFSNLDLLPTADLEFCSTLFRDYQKNALFVMTLYDSVSRSFGQHKRDYPLHEASFDTLSPFSRQLKGVYDALEKLALTRDELTDALIDRMEDYFRDQYHVVFTSYRQQEGAPVHFLETPKPIIINMLCQTGTDLAGRGKQQIISQFHSLFYPHRKHPELKGHAITFHHAGSYLQGTKNEWAILHDDNQNVYALLEAFSLFSAGTLKILPPLRAAYVRWKHTLEFGLDYPIYGGLTIRFFKNGRIDCLLKDENTASQFLAYFDPATRIKINPTR